MLHNTYPVIVLQCDYYNQIWVAPKKPHKNFIWGQRMVNGPLIFLDNVATQSKKTDLRNFQGICHVWLVHFDPKFWEITSGFCLLHVVTKQVFKVNVLSKINNSICHQRCEKELRRW